MGLQAANADERYAQKLRLVMDTNLDSLSQLLHDSSLHKLPSSHRHLVDCHSALSEGLKLLKRKLEAIRTYRTVKPRAKDFKFLRLLGKGSYANVYLARNGSSKRLVAIKVMSKEKIKEEHLEMQVIRERVALATASKQTDFFVRFYSSFQSASKLYLVMEYLQGGDCLTLLNSIKRFPEVVAQHFVTQVCLAVQHLHRNGVVHRWVLYKTLLHLF
ncbi:hypothetical protein EON64_17160 [archaeon]|nr:MAG: hypothetical protein EON64_17160 [archaeon]